VELKKIVKALLFPHIAVLFTLTPISIALLVYAMTTLGEASFAAIISYVLSAYTLTLWCVRIPDIIGWVKRFKNENQYIKMWQNDVRLRVNVTLLLSLLWNTVYGVFQLCLGIYHGTFWFVSLGAYYVILAVMRYFLLSHTCDYAPGERVKRELILYRRCGYILLVMNIALAVITFFMVYHGRTFRHHMITTIAMAAYTFTSLTMAIINLVKYKKYNSPVFSASRSIGLAAALVSMLTLESTMLTAFSDGTMTDLTRKWLLGATGGAISVMIVAAAIYMIVESTKRIKTINIEVENGKQ
jgi:hypothetical protein